MEVDLSRLSPGDIVLDGDPAPPKKGGTAAPPPHFGPCLLWPINHLSQQLLISCMVSPANRHRETKNTEAHHNIFMLFLSSSSFFSSPNLSGRRLDVYHTLAHGVALVRI